VFLLSENDDIRYLVEDEDFFLLIEPDPHRINYGIVKAKVKWRHLTASANEFDWIIKLEVKGKVKEFYTLKFETVEKFYGELDKLSMKITSSRALEMSMIESFLLESCKEFISRYR
jgi:hypothetical protein